MTSGGEHTRLRRAVGTATVTALLVAAAVLHHVGEPAPTVPTAGPTAEPGPTAPPRTFSPARPPRPLPQEGPGVTEPGVLLVARPTVEGDLDVAEWVVLPDAVTSIELEPPPVEAARSAFNGLVAEISSLQVSVDGRTVPAPEGGLTGRTTLTLPRPARAYALHYRLQGSVVPSRPPGGGRALAALAPVATSVPADLPVVVAGYGAAVRKIFCPLGPTPSEPCSTGRPPVRLTDVDLRRDTALVFLKIDLPG